MNLKDLYTEGTQRTMQLLIAAEWGNVDYNFLNSRISNFQVLVLI